MFKNVFLKYIVAFMLIILSIFILLMTVITSLVNTYNTNIKDRMLTKAAYSINNFISEDYSRRTDQSMSFEAYIQKNDSYIVPLVEVVCANNDKIIAFICDAGGNVLLMRSSSDVEPTSCLTSSELDSLSFGEAEYSTFKNGEAATVINDFGGFFKGVHISRVYPISDESGGFVGAIITSSDNSEMDALLNAMIKTVVMSCLWLMLASLVVVYFISERLVSPLRSMSYAAKQFAEGHFDARVEVSGRDEIAQLAVAFNDMAESLSRSEDMRRTFLANVSHDLRTPMTTISGFIDGILDGAIPPEKQPYYLEVIATEVRRLSRLVSSLLDITRMQAGERQFNMVGFDACEMAREILISFEQKIDAKKLEVAFDTDDDNINVLADKDAIHQILYNITDNAIKFSKDGGALAISLKYRTNPKDNRVVVSVYNEGIGISSEDLPYIFERFYKSDKSRGLDKTGVGLGMYISKTIIEAHHEKIWVESEFGSWCRFSFTLKKYE